MSDTAKPDLQKTLKTADKAGLSREVEESIEARLGAQPSDEEEE